MPSVYTMSIVIKNAASLQHRMKAENGRHLNVRDNLRASGKQLMMLQRQLGRERTSVIEKTVECVHLEE